MRRRLIRSSLAVTSMVVLAFLIPLGLLVRDLAHDRAISAAERDAEGIARLVAVVAATQGLETTLDAVAGPRLQDDVSIVLPDGSVLGSPLAAGESLDEARRGAAVRVTVPGGEAVHVPVVQGDGATVVVRVFVPTAALREGVVTSWLLLGMLGVVLIGIGVVVSDRLARSIVVPVTELSATAAAFAQGDLDARVAPSGPEEVREVGAEFNRLAQQVLALLQQERETAADLAHRLRTPLMALRLDIDALPAGRDRRRLSEDLDNLRRQVDFVINEARREIRRRPGTGSDLAATLRERLDFWSALAEEQHRAVHTAVETGTVHVAIAAEDARAMIDALIGNVFAHTDEGTTLGVRLERNGERSTLVVEDAGPGFVDAGVLDRGRTGGGGTGLGLDIARRTAESVGGSLVVEASARLGGAAIRVVLPVDARPTRPPA